MEGGFDPDMITGSTMLLDEKVVKKFQHKFVQVQNILDQNRLLINEINQNHESKAPDNLSRNVRLIGELNNNIRRVVELYAELSSAFVRFREASSEGESAKALSSEKRGSQKRIQSGPSEAQQIESPRQLTLSVSLYLRSSGMKLLAEDALRRLRLIHIRSRQPTDRNSTPRCNNAGFVNMRRLRSFGWRRMKLTVAMCASSAVEEATSTKTEMALEKAGGRMVVELVGAFNELTERMSVLSTKSSRILFVTLKLSIPILQSLPLAPDGRSPLTKTLSVAFILADLQMDAEVISAGMLLELLEVGAITIYEVKERIGTSIAHLLHEGMRVKKIPFKMEVLDDESASALRKFYLTYYEVRALILDLAVKLDMMRHLNYLPRYQQQIFSLEVMKIYAPLAHAVGANVLSLELEDLSFWYLFPYSYFYVDNWLRSHESGSKPLMEVYKQKLLQALQSDIVLAEMVEGIAIMGRYKSRYSTMKKLVKDGRKPEEINDILGLRIILTPKFGDDMGEMGENACYRTCQIIQLLWNVIPNRTKDYIARPKANGYKSLHIAVDLSEGGRPQPPMEIQIRTAEMDMLASGGTASHSFYKGGFTNPEEAQKLKAIMMAAAEVAALRLQEVPTAMHNSIETDQRGGVFRLLDKNGDGKISIEELTDVMVELGASGEDAREMMQLLDSNSDGSLSSDEFDTFQKQVDFMRNLEDRDVHFKTILDEKLHMTD